jgi:hypothetical protein
VPPFSGTISITPITRRVGAAAQDADGELRAGAELLDERGSR